jgi:hypothetical protein
VKAANPASGRVTAWDPVAMAVWALVGMAEWVWETVSAPAMASRDQALVPERAPAPDLPSDLE